MKDLPPELTGRFDLRVEAQHTAAAMGNTHMEVLATPYVVWMIEAAASRAVAPYLDDGEGAAGTQITLRHLAPTAVGRVASATIRLVERTGRRLRFQGTVTSGDTVVAEAEYESAVVNLARILATAREQS